MGKVKRNDKSMGNGLPSAQERKTYDQCCGIHGAARERKGIKRGTNAARRRYEKDLINWELDNMSEDFDN